MSSSRAETLVSILSGKGLRVCCAESLTGGMVSAAIACVPGASRVLWGSFVTYTPEAKENMLNVRRETLETYGAVSRECALEMAAGALEKSGADIAGSVTGLAGPGGDGSGLPVGTVWMAAAVRGGETEAKRFSFSGSRQKIRGDAADALIEELILQASCF